MQRMSQCSGVLVDTNLTILQDSCLKRSIVLDRFVLLISKLSPKFAFNVATYTGPGTSVFSLCINATLFTCRYNWCNINDRSAEISIDVPVDEMFLENSHSGYKCTLQVTFETDLVANTDVNYMARLFTSESTGFLSILSPASPTPEPPHDDDLRAFVESLVHIDDDASTDEVRIAIS